MDLIHKISDFKADWLDVGLTKIAVLGATLMVAKLWEPLLSLEWYWYLIIWVVAAIRPFVTVYKWLTNGAQS